MSPKPLTLKITQWLLVIVSAMGAGSALLVIAASGTLSIIDSVDIEILAKTADRSRLPLLAGVQLVVFTLLIASAIGIIHDKRRAYWSAIGLLAVSAGLNLIPNIDIFGMLLTMVFLALLLKDWRYFGISTPSAGGVAPSSSPRNAGR